LFRVAYHRLPSAGRTARCFLEGFIAEEGLVSGCGLSSWQR
jgi:hypothetical protein